MGKRKFQNWAFYLTTLRHLKESIILLYWVSVQRQNFCSGSLLCSIFWFKFIPFPGMGWFWDSEVAFGCLPGVVLTAVGYAGGTTERPSYYKYHNSDFIKTMDGHPRMGDHTECVRVTYNPEKTNYEDILDAFWRSHDSTVKTSRSEEHKENSKFWSVRLNLQLSSLSSFVVFVFFTACLLCFSSSSLFFFSAVHLLHSSSSSHFVFFAVHLIRSLSSLPFVFFTVFLLGHLSSSSLVFFAVPLLCRFSSSPFVFFAIW